MAKRASSEGFRKVLREKREEIIRITMDGMKKFMSGEIRQVIAAGKEEGDCSVVYQFEHMNCRQFDTQRESIRKIDLALRRLDEGIYGFCAECSEKISVERLKILPFALLCKDCQETKEKQAKIGAGLRIDSRAYRR
jgi:DnaK suppressor protein